MTHKVRLVKRTSAPAPTGAVGKAKVDLEPLTQQATTTNDEPTDELGEETLAEAVQRKLQRRGTANRLARQEWRRIWQ